MDSTVGVGPLPPRRGRGTVCNRAAHRPRCSSIEREKSVRYLLCNAPGGRVPRKRYRTLFSRTTLTQYRGRHRFSPSTSAPLCNPNGRDCRGGIACIRRGANDRRVFVRPDPRAFGTGDRHCHGRASRPEDRPTDSLGCSLDSLAGHPPADESGVPTAAPSPTDLLARGGHRRANGTHASNSGSGSVLSERTTRAPPDLRQSQPCSA